MPAELGKRPSGDGDLCFPSSGHGFVITSPRGEAQSRGANPGARGWGNRCCSLRAQRALVPGAAIVGPPPPQLASGPQGPTAQLSVLPGLCTSLWVACSRPCGILSPNLRLTDGWMLGGPHVWSSSREKPQVQPSKSINKLISKYCCLLSRTGTPGEQISNQQQTATGHAGNQGIISGWNFQSPPLLPGLETRLGARASRELRGTESVTEESVFRSRVHLSFSLARVCCSLRRAGLGAQLAGALIWVPRMMMWVTKEP